MKSLVDLYSYAGLPMLCGNNIENAFPANLEFDILFNCLKFEKGFHRVILQQLDLGLFR